MMGNQYRKGLAPQLERRQGDLLEDRTAGCGDIQSHHRMRQEFPDVLLRVRRETERSGLANRRASNSLPNHALGG